MRNRILGVLAGLLLAAPTALYAQQQESVADAARKAREKRKAAAPAKKTYTNDDMGVARPDSPAPAADTAGAAAAAGSADAAGKAEETPEQKWRKRFAEAREKLAAAEKELALLQRELSENQVQYYADPQKTLEQEVFRSDINNKRKSIEDKQKEIAAIKQSIEDMERQMRAEGGYPGWAR